MADKKDVPGDTTISPIIKFFVFLKIKIVRGFLKVHRGITLFYII